MNLDKETTTPVILTANTIAKAPIETFDDPRRGHGLSWKTLTSSSKNSTDSMTSGIFNLQPKGGYLCEHRHKQAELYHVLEGEGFLQIDGIKRHVRKGDVAFIPGNSKHGISNPSKTSVLVCFYVFAADDFNDIQYRFPHEESLSKV